MLIMGIKSDTLKFLSDNYVPVWGHVGILSGWQTGLYGGYRRVGKTAQDAMAIYRQAYEYQENGMVGMTIEMTPREITCAATHGSITRTRIKMALSASAPSGCTTRSRAPVPGSYRPTSSA